MELITDRTYYDVTCRNSKGTYRAEDLNRVEGAVEQLAALLWRAGIRITVTTKTDWKPPTGGFDPAEWVTAAGMRRYLGNVKKVCAACGADTDKLPNSMDGLTYEGANNIELCLLEAESGIENRLLHYRYTAEAVCGEENSV